VPAGQGSLVIREDRQPEVVQGDLAAGGPVQAAEQVQERGLAAAGRAHDGDEIPPLDGEVDARQRVDRLRAQPVLLPELRGLEDGHL